MANSLAWISGGVAGWTPASEPSLLGWWKADSLSLADGASVTSWSDSGPNGYTMSLPVGNFHNPVYHTNIKNSLPSVLFTASNNQALTSSMPSDTNPFTVAAVIFSNTFSSGIPGAWFGSTANNDLEWRVNGAAQEMVGQNTVIIATNSQFMFDGNWYVIVMTYDGSGNYAFYQNGASGASGTNVKSFTGAGTTSMGTAQSFTGDFFDGYISEIIKFSSVVSASQIDTYLNGRWAVH